MEPSFVNRRYLNGLNSVANKKVRVEQKNTKPLQAVLSLLIREVQKVLIDGKCLLVLICFKRYREVSSLLFFNQNKYGG